MNKDLNVHRLDQLNGDVKSESYPPLEYKAKLITEERLIDSALDDLKSALCKEMLSMASSNVEKRHDGLVEVTLMLTAYHIKDYRVEQLEREQASMNVYLEHQRQRMMELEAENMRLKKPWWKKIFGGSR